MAYPRKNKDGTNTWYVVYSLASGKRRREACEAKTQKQAEVLEAQLRVREERRRLGLEALDRNPKNHTVGTLVTWYLEKTAKTANARHLSDTLHAHVVGDFASMRIERVDGPTMQAFLAAFERKPIAETGEQRSPSSVNRLRAYISGMFREARLEGLLVGDNPVKLTRARKVETEPARPLPAELVRPIMDAAPRAWRLPIVIACWTGLRFSEIARLDEPGLVDLDVGVIHVRKTKAGKARIVPIHPELLAELVIAKAEGTSLTPNRGRASDAVRRAMLFAGVEAPEGIDACFKILRSTWASQWIVGGAPSWLVEWVGWGPREGSVMQRHYISVPIATLKEEIVKLAWPTAPNTSPTSDGGGVLENAPPQISHTADAANDNTDNKTEQTMKSDEVKKNCRRRGSNPHDPRGPKDFKSAHHSSNIGNARSIAATAGAWRRNSRTNRNGSTINNTHATHESGIGSRFTVPVHQCFEALTA